MKHPDIAVLIPALDEGAALRRLLPQLTGVATVIVIDNGSTDDTAAVAASFGAEVVGEPRRGYGHAVSAGLDRADALGAAVAVVLDADMADDPRLLGALLAPLRDGSADLVCAERTALAGAGALTWPQRVGNRLALAGIAHLTGATFRDLGPWRAATLSTWRAIALTDRTWGWNVEMNVRAARMGLRVVEVPLPYRPRKVGRSKISGTVMGTVRAGYRILATLVRLRDS